MGDQTRVRNLQPGQKFQLKRTGDWYEFLGHKRDTPSGTQYIVRRSGFAKPSTLHHSCHVVLEGQNMTTTPTSGAADLPEALRLHALTAQAPNQPGGFSSGDMASAAAQGYRDGWTAAQAISAEPAGAGYAELPMQFACSGVFPVYSADQMRAFADATHALRTKSEAIREFLERMLSAMEGVIDVADRKTAEFDALRSCVVDLTLMLFKPEALRASHGQAPAVGTIGHVGDGKTTLTAAIASLLAPTPQADSQPAPVRDYPPLPQGWPARFRCDSCDGNGEVGEPMYMGHFQPPERARCPDCDGRGWCSEEAAFSADHMRAYVDADRAARAPADSVLEDAARDHIRALIAQHADILEQNESAYFELCYHRATGWMAWITDKPLCMPPVINPGRTVLAQGQGDTPDEACADAARKQGGSHD